MTYTQVTTGDIRQLEPGLYYCNPGVANLPHNYYSYVDIVNMGPGKRVIVHPVDEAAMYRCFYSSGVWTSWVRFVSNSDLDKTVRFVNGAQSNFWVHLNPENKRLYIYDGPDQKTGANMIGVLDLA